MVGESSDQLTFKIIVIGDVSVGKTAIIKRYTEGVFVSGYKTTIGVDFAIKLVDWDDGTRVMLQLWDISGQDTVRGKMTRVYYKYASAAIIVFDVAQPSSFEGVAKWHEDFTSKMQGIPCMLLANKCDLPGVDLNQYDINGFVEKHGLIGWYKTSALNGENIDLAMKQVITEILNTKDKIPQPQAAGGFMVKAAKANPNQTNQQNQKSNEGGGCC